MSKRNIPTHLLHDERGAVAVEYGLILALLVIAIMGALDAFANENNNMWGRVKTAVEEVRN